MVEKRQLKLATNAKAIDRWMRRLFRATNELKYLYDQRKRLLKPAKVVDTSELNDPLPTFDTPAAAAIAKAVGRFKGRKGR